MPKLGLGTTVSKKAISLPGVISTGRTVNASFSTPDDILLSPNLVPDMTDLTENDAGMTGTRNLVGDTIVFESCGSSGLQTAYTSRGYIADQIYRVEFTVSDYNGDGINDKFNISIGNTQAPEGLKARGNGTYRYYIKYTAGAAASYLYASDFTGTISNISVHHVKSYTGQALEFDGVSDEISFDPIMGGETELTISAWIKKDVGAHASTDGAITGYNSGGTYLRFTDDTTLHFYLDTAQNDISYNVTWSDDGDWHYVVVTYEQNTLSNIYIDGVLAGSSSSAYRGAINASTGRLARVGNYGAVGANLFSGQMCNFQVWNKEWSADDVAYAYANRETLVNLPYENLKLWYPMQGGHKGEQSYVFDGSNTGLGPELIDNNAWTFSGSGTIDWVANGNGSFSVTSPSADSSWIVQTAITSSSSYTYALTYTISNATVSGGANLRVSGGNSAFGTVSLPSTDGDHTVYLGSGKNSGATNLQINENGFVGTISNISLKAINLKNHGVSSFFGDDLLLKGNPVDDNSDWTAGTGWIADSANERLLASNATDNIRATTTTSFVNGDQISVTFTVANRSGGSVRMIVGGSNNGITRDADGTYTEAVTVSGMAGSYIYFDGVDSFSGEIKNITVKKVGFATGWSDADSQPVIPQLGFQSFNELLWMDGHADHVSLGSQSVGANESTTLSAWIYLVDGSSTAVSPIILFGDLHLRAQSDTSIKMYPDQGVGSTTVTVPSLFGKWHHVVFTSANGSPNNTNSLYLDGVLVDSGTGGGNTSADSVTSYIGRHGSDYFNGVITEVSYWDTAMSEKYVQELYNNGEALYAKDHTLSSNLKGYWRNNNKAVWTDLSGENNHGTPSSASEYLVLPEHTGRKDIHGFDMNKIRSNGLSAPADTSYQSFIDLGSTTTINAGTAFSVTGWLKPSDLSLNYFMGSASNNYISILSSGVIKLAAQSVEHSFNIGTLSVDRWFHIALVRNSSNVTKCYIDGVLNGGAAEDTETVSQNFSYRYLGNRDTVYSFRGTIDDLSIYNGTELSQSQVKRNYQAGKRRHTN